MNQIQLIQSVLRRCGLQRPDRRPLFAYRLEETELSCLTGLMRQMIKGVARGNRYPHFEELFCLYAAETFRQEHEGGPWAYETVFRPLGVDQPAPENLQHWIEAGLLWWHRPLIHGPRGQRLFLVTLACEGGLPLRVLKQPDTRLSMFFAELLEEYHRAGTLGEADAYARAQQLAHLLPLTLRQDVVFQLSGRLVASAVQLWQAVGDVPEPILALNDQVPDWRLQLPLNADDATLHALLAPLLSRIGGLEQAANTGLRWRGLLREKMPGVWSIEKALDLPETIDSTVLCH